jgi:outer membrane lipoprotein-sorting protein
LSPETDLIESDAALITRLQRGDQDVGDDDKDLRDLFRSSAPNVSRVDVEALLSAAQARHPDRRRLAWPQFISQSHDPVHGHSVSETLRRIPLWKRGLAMSIPIAASVVVVAALTALLIPRESAAEVTLAEVQANVERKRTVTCKVTQSTVSTPQTAGQSHRLLIQGPNLVRDESHEVGYTITDFSLRKSISVDPTKKLVRITEGINLPNLNFYDMIRSIAADPTKTLPPREINGTKSLGFIVRPPIVNGVPQEPNGFKSEITIWVDPRTKLPLRIETTSTDQRGVTVTQVYSDIVFDVPLDAALFAMSPPDGYRIESFGVAKLQPEIAPNDARQLVITPGVGIGPVRFGMKTTDVIQLLGPPDKTLNPAKGMDVLEYYSQGFSITARDARGVVMITCFTGRFLAVKVCDFAGRTDKGVRMGVSRAAIEKAYGPPSSVRVTDVFGKPAANAGQKTGQVDLSYETPRISFSLHDDSLESITILAPRQTTSAKPINQAPPTPPAEDQGRKRPQ